MATGDPELVGLASFCAISHIFYLQMYIGSLRSEQRTGNWNYILTLVIFCDIAHIYKPFGISAQHEEEARIGRIESEHNISHGYKLVSIMHSRDNIRLKRLE